MVAAANLWCTQNKGRALPPPPPSAAARGGRSCLGGHVAVVSRASLQTPHPSSSFLRGWMGEGARAGLRGRAGRAACRELGWWRFVIGNGERNPGLLAEGLGGAEALLGGGCRVFL